jgi:hypothetical protein
MPDDQLRRCPRPECGANMPLEFHFCGRCGTSLAPELDTLRRLVDDTIGAALDERLKDRKHVEIEVAAEVTQRVIGWMKLLFLLVGVPVALLGVVLAVLGISSYADFKATVASARDKFAAEARTKTTSFEAEAKKLQARTRALGERFKAQEVFLDRLEKQLPEIESQLAEIPKLRKRVEEIELFGFKAQPAQGEQKAYIEQHLTPYREYLRSLGLRGTVEVPVYILSDPSESLTSFYDPSGKRIAINPKWLRQPLYLLGAYTHHPLRESVEMDTWSKMPRQSQGVVALEQSLVLYLPASFLEEPSAGPVRRPLSALDTADSYYEAAYTVSAALWSLGETLGQRRLAELTVHVWMTIRPAEWVGKPSEVLARFFQVMLSKAQPDEQAAIQGLLDDFRGTN